MLELINLLNTWFLIGLIWIVQIVHYPSFRFFDEKNFLPAHHFHTQSIVKIVGPTMLSELLLGGFLVYQTQLQIDYLLPFLALVGIWASTLLFQIPLHAKLGERFEQKDIEKLIATNWIRTILWTLKGLWLARIFLNEQALL